MARTIQSPGVEINEIDLSLRPDLPVGTNILIPGFSPTGPVDEVLQVASLSEFEQVYGLPTNAAERYFYHTVRGAFQSPGNIYVSRLPYGADRGDTFEDKHYSATIYPVRPVKHTYNEGNVVSTEFVDDYKNYNEINGYDIHAPEFIELNQDQYQKLIDGEVEWNSTYTTSNASLSGDSDGTIMQRIGNAGIVILNHRSFTVNEKFEGYYVGLADSDDFFPNSNYESVKSVRTINKNSATQSKSLENAYRDIPTSRLSFGLDCANETAESATPGLNRYAEGTVSEVVENLPSFDISTDEFTDILVLGLFKLRKSTLDPDTEKLDYVLSEYHIGSLNSNRQQYDPNGGTPVSFALKDLTDSSPNVQLFINKHISESGDWVDRYGDSREDKYGTRTSPGSGVEVEDFVSESVLSRIKMTVKPEAKALFAHGLYKEAAVTTNQVGAIPTKLERIFELIDNHELFPLDLTLEGGLGTIFAATNGGRDTANFDDEKALNLMSSAANGGPSWDPIDGPSHAWDYSYTDGEGKTQNLLYSAGQHQFLGGPVIWYRNVANRFVEFAEKKRKDHMCILDPMRHIFVQGVNSTVLSDKNKNFSQHVYWPLRHIYSSINTSYGAVYGNWSKVFDGQLGRNVWVPMSGYMAAMYANTDANYQPWFAPAGFTRGVLNGIADIAVYPKQKHRDQLYKINVNPVANFPNDGFVVFGQKTLLSKPSAFDRVNVRRLFLYLEKATRATVKYFVFEPNTLFTRTQVGNVLAPIFDRAKNTQGLYDYLLICDERNNTPDVIDQNEMVIDIYIKPVRAAEFILVNFYATRTGQDFSELVS